MITYFINLKKNSIHLLFKKKVNLNRKKMIFFTTFFYLKP